MAARIKKGDRVIVLTGRDRGREGEVLEMRPSQNRAVVADINKVKRHTRPTQADPEGGVREKEASIHISNIALVDPKDGKPTRVGFRILDDGRKVRYAKRSGDILDG